MEKSPEVGNCCGPFIPIDEAHFGTLSYFASGKPQVAILVSHTCVYSVYVTVCLNSSRMTNKEKESERLDLLQGTLEMMALRTLLLGPANGYQIARTIEQMS